MALSDLIAARRSIAAGVGSTTRRNRVLPGAGDLPTIPARPGVGKPIIQSIKKLARGFLAWVSGATRACLFAHDTLAVRDASYTKFGHTYSVLPFATPFNVSDETGLHDVLSFVDGEVLVNAAGMPVLGVTTGAPMSGALPWLIPHDTPVGDLGEYGDAVTNASVKRVFSVSRDRVHAWQATEPDHVLGGATYRAEAKALLHGARINVAAHSAHLSQTVFTGASWDALTSSWEVYVADVQMALVSPFVAGVNSSFVAEGVTAAPALVSSTPVSQQTSYAPGDAPVCAYGPVYEWSRVINPNVDGGVPTIIKFRCDLTSIYSKAPEAAETYKTTTGSASIYSGATTQSFEGASGTLSAVVSVSRSYASLSEVAHAALSGETPAEALATPTSRKTYLVTKDNSTSPYFNAEDEPAGAYGNNNAFTSTGAATRTFTTTSKSYTTDEHVVDASVDLSTYAEPLVSVSARIDERAGQEARLSPVTPAINQFTTRPEVWSELKVEESWAYYPTATYNAHIRQGSANVVWLADRIVGKQLYAEARLSAIGYTDASTTRNEFSATLAWETRDFVLFDAAEQVFVYVLGTCAGSQSDAAATLTVDVQLVIDVRGAKQYVTLGHYEYSQVELLPTVPLGLGTSLEYLPAPKIRPMFAPRHQSQGDFDGAVYTTQAEETAGATPACLMNFVLELATYASIGDSETSPNVVRFIPCNLIEMLYAYVFSSKYGVDSTQRYPVDFTTRYTDMSTTLFGVPHRIAYRDGALVDWLDTLGDTYAAGEQIGVYRI